MSGSVESPVRGGDTRRDPRGARARSPAPRVALDPRARGLRGPSSRASSSRSRSQSCSSPRMRTGISTGSSDALAESGNQVFFTTHAPGLLSLAALDEVNLVTRDELGRDCGRAAAADRTSTTRSGSCASSTRSAPSSSFSRAAILVEGLTEKITLPLVFQALGHDPDGEQISIVRVRWQDQSAALHRDLSTGTGSIRGHPRQRSMAGARAVGRQCEAERAHPPAGGRAANHRARAGLRERRRISRKGIKARAGVVPPGACAPGRTARAPRARREARSRLG